MMFGERVSRIRKEKSLSQNELGKVAGMSGDMIGKYERGEMKPNIDTATKIAEALGVSLDYLVGSGSSKVIDKGMLNRLALIEEMPDNLKNHVLHFIDMSIRDFKAKQAYS